MLVKDLPSFSPADCRLRGHHYAAVSPHLRSFLVDMISSVAPAASSTGADCESMTEGGRCVRMAAQKIVSVIFGCWQAPDEICEAEGWPTPRLTDAWYVWCGISWKPIFCTLSVTGCLDSSDNLPFSQKFSFCDGDEMEAVYYLAKLNKTEPNHTWRSKCVKGTYTRTLFDLNNSTRQQNQLFFLNGQRWWVADYWFFFQAQLMCAEEQHS